ncbi:MAG: prepilin-type N-terminal cleavage/methylation domain-containing protein [Candidatus Aminicenantaceae bacterium]
MKNCKNHRRFSKIRFKPKGITLIEFLVATAIGVIILIGILTLYSTGQRYLINGGIRADVLHDGRYVLEWLSRDIKEAIQIIQSWDVYSTTSDSLVLEIPSINSSGFIVDIENDFDYIIYRQKPQFAHKLERIVDAKDGVSSRVDSSRIIANRISSFVLSSEGVEFSSTSDFSTVSYIDISLTTRKTYIGRLFEETLNTVVKLRNKSKED